MTRTEPGGAGANAHFEPFVHLVDVDDDQALIAWGGFWFVPFDDGNGMQIVDDQRLDDMEAGRLGSIGRNSEPYGHAVVEAYDASGRIAARAETADTNHVWLRGLSADTEYRYSITVDGEPWAAGERMDWHRLDDRRGELRRSGHSYDLRFRTFPDRTSDAELTFLALGDYGVGIQSPDEQAVYQADLAAAMTRAIDHHDVRLILTLGDNIYHFEDKGVGGSGGEDDDWYFSFYEPYRWALARVPVFPTVGNHDSDETESSDDRDELNDNHFIEERFVPEVEEGRASIVPGLFYQLDHSRRVRFVCIDTSRSTDLDSDRYFDHAEHLDFVERALRGDGDERVGQWRIPFCHHPPFCAGPSHDNDVPMIETLVPRFEEHGVRLVLSGHEHNFQYNVRNGVHYVVSGAGGKLRTGRPDHFADAHTVAWAATPHFLLVRIEGTRCRIWPLTDVGDEGELTCLDAERPEGGTLDLPIEIEL